jgi:hypothetical protein
MGDVRLTSLGVVTEGRVEMGPQCGGDDAKKEHDDTNKEVAHG